MDILDEIFKKNEYEDINRYEKVLNDFLEEAQISFPSNIVDINGDPFIKFRLFHMDYIYTSNYTDLYFSILL